MASILIIENDPEIHEYYNELLYDEGYQVINCYSGEDGLPKIKKYDPDLLILDMDLGGGITGRDVVIEIKKMKTKLPILVISGKSGMESDPELATSANVYRFFVKPVSLKELSVTIEKIFAPKIQPSQHTVSKSASKEKIGGCVLENCIGKGGSGTVYKAMRIDTPVAIKILSGDLLLEEDFGRFEREVQALARLEHPTIVNLLDTGQTKKGDLFIVMDYFDGTCLESILAQEQYMPETEVRKIVCQLAQGMTVAHNAKIIHRDIKPSNILYCREKKEVKIIDFGIARNLLSTKVITLKDCILGTPLYMSPEQCLGKTLDERSDIYSLGATFYHMLTGKAPFVKESVTEVMFDHIIANLSWPSEPEISSSTKQIVEKMMQKDSTKRYNNMEEITEQLFL